MKKIFILPIISSLLFCGGEIFSQNIAINTTGGTGNCNALLDLNTGNTFSGANNGRGLLIPNLNLSTTADISMFPTGTCAVPQSTLIYNTNNAITGVGAAGIGYYYYDTGTSRWINLVDNLAPGSAWMLAGNTSISTPVPPGTYGTSLIGATENWIGTTDANDVVFGTSNIERMRIDQTTGFVGIGRAPHASRTLAVSSSTAVNDAAAVWGNASGNANRVYGVYGSTSSTFLNSAGVRGFAIGNSLVDATYAISGENQSASGYGVYGVNTYFGAAGNILCGVYGVKNGAATTGTGYGVYGTAISSAATNIGGYFSANGATTNIALSLKASTGTSIGMRMAGSTSGTLDISPAAATTSYALTLPAAQGGASTFLQNDGSGNLSWGAGGSGTVTSVGGTAPIVSSGGTAPVISLQGTAGGVVYGAGAGSGVSAAGTAGQVLISGAGGAPTWSNRLITNETANPWKVFYSNAAGTIIELALPAAGLVLTSTGAAAAPVWSAGGTGAVIYLGGCEVTASGFGAINPAACMSYALAANTYTNIKTTADVGLLSNGLSSTINFNIYYLGVLKKTMTLAYLGAGMNGHIDFATVSFIGPQAAAAAITVGVGVPTGTATWYVYNMRVYGIK